MKKTTLTVALVLGATVLTGCSDQYGDRGGIDGVAPDYIGDVDCSEVSQQDGFPNIARTCVLGLGFATPSSGNGDFGGARPHSSGSPSGMRSARPSPRPGDRC